MIKVMIVDDSTVIRSFVKNMFINSDIQLVGEAENGKIAVDSFQKLNPDVVLMDINMPEMDGIEALKNIKIINPSAKVIMLTTVEKKDRMVDALKAGAFHYIEKPFNEDDLIDLIRKAYTYRRM